MVRPTTCLSSVAVPTARPAPATTSTAARGRRSSRQPVTAATITIADPTGSPRKSRVRATYRHGGPTLSAVGGMIHLSTLPDWLWPAYMTATTTTTSAARAAISPSRARSDGGSTAGAGRPVTGPPRRPAVAARGRQDADRVGGGRDRPLAAAAPPSPRSRP